MMADSVQRAYERWRKRELMTPLPAWDDLTSTERRALFGTAEEANEDLMDLLGDVLEPLRFANENQSPPDYWGVLQSVIERRLGIEQNELQPVDAAKRVARR